MAHIIKKEKQESKTIEDLCEIALQLDADYFILGDTKGKEAYGIYNALISGYTPWTNVRASSCKNALQNLENMIIDAQPTLERKSIQELIDLKFEIIIYMEDKKVIEFMDRSKK